MSRSRSLWWDAIGEPVPRDPLDGDTHADVAIVGAGYTGLWTAYYLKRADPTLRIVVVDAHLAGFGASGRNGGWCSALFPASIDKVARGSSRSQALAMQHAMHATVAEVGRVVSTEGIDCDWHQGGTVGLARTAPQLVRAREEIDHWASWGFGPADYRLLDATAARAMVGATDVLGATYTPHCARIQPAKLARGLADVVCAAGVVLHENTPALGIQENLVVTARGNIRAPFIVRATEAFTARLPRYRRRLLPVYSLMLATQPLPEPVWAAIGLGQSPTFNDGRHLIIYGQRTADDRLAFGGRGAPYYFGSAVHPDRDHNAKVHAELWRTLVGLFPVVGDFQVTHRWGGALGVPRDWYASCGLDVRTGIAWSGGYVGDGVGTANLGGRTLANLILGRETGLTNLPWVNHHSRSWEPEPLRWIGANGGLAIMSSADGAEQRTGRPARRAKLFGRLLGH